VLLSAVDGINDGPPTQIKKAGSRRLAKNNTKMGRKGQTGEGAKRKKKNPVRRTTREYEKGDVEQEHAGKEWGMRESERTPRGLKQRGRVAGFPAGLCDLAVIVSVRGQAPLNLTPKRKIYGHWKNGGRIPVAELNTLPRGSASFTGTLCQEESSNGDQNGNTVAEGKLEKGRPTHNQSPRSSSRPNHRKRHSVKKARPKSQN